MYQNAALFSTSRAFFVVIALFLLRGFIHLSIAVGSKKAVDAKAKELDAAGYACIDGPRTTGDGYYEAQVVGPEGIALEITA